MAKTKQPYILITKKNKQGNSSFYIRIFTENGKYTEKSLSCNTLSQATVKAGEVYQEFLQEKESRESCGISCQQLFDTVYLSDEALYYSLHNVSRAIKRQQQNIVKNHILPFFKKKMCGEITLNDVSAFIKWLDNKKSVLDPEKTLSKKTQKEIFILTKAAFAMLNDIDTKHIYRNVFASKVIPKIKIEEKNRTDAFTLEEINKLLSVQWEHPVVYSLAVLCAFTGLRTNEACCLRYEDFTEFENYLEISINKNWDPAFHREKKPKTESGNRVVVIKKSIFEKIKKGLWWIPSCFVFSMDGFKPIDYRIYSRYLNKAIKTAQIGEGKRLVFYSFRPFYKSLTSPFLSSELSNYVMGHAENSMGEHYFHYDRSVHASLLMKAVRQIKLPRKTPEY